MNRLMISKRIRKFVTSSEIRIVLKTNRETTRHEQYCEHIKAGILNDLEIETSRLRHDNSRRFHRSRNPRGSFDI